MKGCSQAAQAPRCRQAPAHVYSCVHQACQQDLDTYQGIVAAVLILQRVLGRLTALWQDVLATQGRVGLPGSCLYIA